MNTKKLLSIALVIFVTGCGSNQYLKKISPFKKDGATLEPKKGAQSSGVQKSNEIFVCAGDVDVTYKKLGEVSLGEFGFSGHDILAFKIKEKAVAVGAQAVINVQYDTGASKTWQGYGELGGTDYGVKHTSWCNGIAVVFMESHNPLGLLLCNLTKENREWFGFKKSQKGVIVVNVMSGSIAANAGIMVEDFITEWAGNKIENRNQLRQLIDANAGKEVKLNLLRAGEIKIVTVSIPTPAHSRVASTTSKSYGKENKPTIEKKESSPRKLSSNSADVHNEVGDLYLRKGMYDEAMEEYKKAIEADPYCAIAHFNLSIVYDKKGMKEEADEEYAAYKKLKPRRK
ncbi:MAG: tetratricopeptide repeat protein [Candidatus Brocadiaceae bacterium]|nr:tetratricopeptide repeat protein [Candidatus Brocadiaceae bacterium]